MEMNNIIIGGGDDGEGGVWIALQCSICFVFFSFTAFFSVFSLLVFFLRLKLWCNCEVCHGYLTSSWAAKYDNLCDWYTHLLRNSPTQTIHIHILGNVVTANPKNVEHMLKARFDNYPKGQPFSTILGDLLGRGIFNVDGHLWLYQRKMASLELGSVSVRSHALRVFSSEIRRRLLPLLSASAAEGQQMDLQDLLRRFAFDNICMVSFGLDPGCLEAELPEADLPAAFDLATNLSARRATAASPWVWRVKRLLNVGTEMRLREAIKVVNQLAEGVIRQRRAMGFSGHHDLLSRFMASVNDDAYLRDIVVSFLLAGRDTVASALTSFFWLVARSPEVETKIRAEIHECMAGGDEDVPTFEQLKTMHYLHAALYECMRLYPPVQFDSKHASEDDVLPDGTFVKSGTRVTYHPYAMGRMERVWGGDWESFRPERWLVGGRFSPKSPFKYPVFQGGLRVCLGKELAVVEMKSTAAAVLRRFRIEVLDKSCRPKFASGLTASLNGGLPVRVHTINSSQS